MELRDVIATETSAFAERLIAAADAATQKVKKDADAAIAELRGQVETIGAALAAQTERADTVAKRLEEESARAQQLSTQLDAESTRTRTLAGEVEAATKRAEAATPHEIDAQYLHGLGERFPC